MSVRPTVCSCWSIGVLLLPVVLLLPRPAVAQLQVLPVPYRAFDVTIPHPAYHGPRPAP